MGSMSRNWSMTTLSAAATNDMSPPTRRASAACARVLPSSDPAEDNPEHSFTGSITEHRAPQAGPAVTDAVSAGRTQSSKLAPPTVLAKAFLSSDECQRANSRRSTLGRVVPYSVVQIGQALEQQQQQQLQQQLQQLQSHQQHHHQRHGHEHEYSAPGAHARLPRAPPRLRHRLSEIFGSVPTSVHSTRRSSGRSESRKVSASRRSTGAGLVRRRSVIRVELEKEVQLVKKNIRAKKPWADALHVMRIVVANTLTSVAVAWLVVFACVVGSPWLPTFPKARRAASMEHAAWRWHAHAAIAFYFVLVSSLGSLCVFAFILAKALSALTTRSGGAVASSVSRTCLQLLGASWPVLLGVVLVGVGFLELMVATPTETARYGHLQVFVLFATTHVYSCFAAKVAYSRYRRLIKDCTRGTGSISSVTSTRTSNSSVIECNGVALSSMPVVSVDKTPTEANGGVDLYVAKVTPVVSAGVSPAWTHRVVDHALPFVSFNVAFLYMHVSSRVDLDAQWKVFLYAGASMLLKILLQEATKRFQLHGERMPPGLVVHTALTVPTVAIDAQIRLVFVQLGGGQSVIATSVAIVFCELLFRVAKILRLRHTISSRLVECKSMNRIMQRVNSKIAPRTVAAARAEYSLFLDWKYYLLRVHAAEVYADMHGEYISVGCSTAIMFFLRDHPLFAFADDAGASSTVAVVPIEKQMGAAVGQVLFGLVADYVLSVVEGIHEVPLYETIDDEGAWLRPFLRVLLAALAAMSAGAMAIFFLRFDA